MERYLKRASGRARSSLFHALPDELLLAVFQLVPQVACKPLEPALTLKCRGPLERVCPRWRRLALQLPASLSIKLCALHDLGLDEDAAAAAVERLLPHLSCRDIEALAVVGCTFELAPQIPAALARVLYPELRSLRLGGASLLHFSSFLPLCRRLEVLNMCTSHLGEEAKQLQLLCAHLCGLPCPLQQLKLHLHEPDGTLLSTVRRHVRLAALTLSVATPAALEWLPQLQHCTIWVRSDAHIGLLDRGLDSSAARQLLQLSSMVINDGRAVTEREMFPPNFPALAHLPALRKLECDGSMVVSAWQCPHLTSLRIRRVPGLGLSESHIGAVRCTGLRQLQLESCSFDDLVFPGAMGSALRQLSSLAFIGSDYFRASAEFSLLSSLRQLVIDAGGVDCHAIDALSLLPGLTALGLPDCDLESLPDGPYLRNLRSLDLAGRNPQLASPIPFAATAASGLQALRINCDVAEADEWWADVQWKLRCFPGLKVLCLDLGQEDYLHPQADVLEELICSELPGCKVELDGELTAAIKPPSPDTFRRLPGLTALHLADCRLEDLPGDHYLSKLKGLELSGSSSQLAPPIPFAATVARQLHTPRNTWNPLDPVDWWQDVQWKLHCFPGLKGELHVVGQHQRLSLDWGWQDGAQPALEQRCDWMRSDFPSCQLDLGGHMRDHEYFSRAAPQ